MNGIGNWQLALNTILQSKYGEAGRVVQGRPEPNEQSQQQRTGGDDNNNTKSIIIASAVTIK